MGTSYAERMAELPKSEDLGTYTAEAKRIKAELRLRADLKGVGVVDSGTDWYVADVKFFTDPQYESDSEGFSVTAHYSSNVLGEIFARMKAAEEGIEEFLRRGISYDNNWRETREVMRCIFSLEDQTKHLYGERREAEKQRNLVVYGRENPRRT